MPGMLSLGALLAAGCIAPVAPPPTEELPPPALSVATATHFPTSTAPPSDTPEPTAPPPPTSQPTAAGPTVTHTAPSPDLQTAAQSAAPPPTALSQPPAAASGTAHTYYPPVVMANYLPWYDTGSWSRGCTSDSPAAGPYLSEDAATIARHIAEGQRAGLDGFNVHWISPGDRTDAVLASVLAQGGGVFKAAATFLNHSFTAASRATIAANLGYILSTHGTSPGYLKLGGRPVIFFAGMPRVDTSGGLAPEAAWAQIRAAADPNRTSIWIAEGLDPVYLDAFDGLYVYKIDHACCPYAYQSAERWVGWVRAAEQRTGQQKYFAATIQPGWNDVLSTSPDCADNRVGVETFSRDREGGAYYERTFNSAMATRADVLLVNSFNEWVEGSHIEPSAALGELYLDLTAQFAARYRASR